jgi:hypothetical protein
MILFLGRKWPCLILAAYLVVAIMGLFTFAAAEPLRSVDLWADEPESDVFFAPIDFTIDCLAEGETVMSRVRGYSFFPLRTGFLRILMLIGLQYAGFILIQSSLKKSEKVNYLTIKNAVLLKLLI